MLGAQGRAAKKAAEERVLILVFREDMLGGVESVLCREQKRQS